MSLDSWEAFQETPALFGKQRKQKVIWLLEIVMMVLYTGQSLSKRTQKRAHNRFKIRKQSMELSWSQNCEEERKRGRGGTNHVSGKIQGRGAKKGKIRNWKARVKREQGCSGRTRGVPGHRKTSPLPVLPTPNGDGALQKFICQGINEYEFMIMNMSYSYRTQ